MYASHLFVANDVIIDLSDFCHFRSLLTDLYRTICLCVKELMKNNPEQPVCLVMDDFSLLLSLGLQLQELVKFVHQCHFLLCTTVGYCKVSFIFFTFFSHLKMI